VDSTYVSNQFGLSSWYSGDFYHSHVIAREGNLHVEEKMHELTVTESILDIVIKHAQQARASKITDINLVLGDLSSIVDDSVQFYWDMISEGTLAEGAVLHFNRIQTEMECLECKTRYKPPEGDLSCPECQSRKVKIITGEEFFVDSIEVEFDEDVQKEPDGDNG
jgi:hydrogenase nickel incorporation protein HypA/HybF